MSKVLYYVVEKELQDVDGFEETTGNKTVSMYDVDNGKVVPFGDDLHLQNDDNTVKEIQCYLDDNGYGDDDIELRQL